MELTVTAAFAVHIYISSIPIKILRLFLRPPGLLRQLHGVLNYFPWEVLMVASMKSIKQLTPINSFQIDM